MFMLNACGVVTSPIGFELPFKQPEKTRPPGPQTINYRETPIVYEKVRRGEHVIDILGGEIGFSGADKNKVFQKLDAWLNNKNGDNNDDKQ